MSKLDDLNSKNNFPVYDIEGERFRSYGRIIKAYDSSDLIKCAEEDTPIPEEGNIYVPSFEGFEKITSIKDLRDVYYGGLEIQAGYCNGRNSTFNGFEYHKAPEINIAVTDLCLALGHSWEISDDLKYDVSQAEVFFVKKGTVFEMFGTTLHLSPMKVTDDGFKAVVILPMGTNTPLSDIQKEEAKKAYEEGDREARLLLQKNKWVVSHPEREPLIKQGAYPGVTGPNMEVRY